MTGLGAVDHLAAAGDQLPEDVGKAGPIGLVIILVLLIAAALLVKSMSRHLKRVPPSFDPEDRLPEVPDSPAELLDSPASPAAKEPGQDLLEELRRAPRAIEPPRRADGRPDTPPRGADRPASEPGGYSER